MFSGQDLDHFFAKALSKIFSENVMFFSEAPGFLGHSTNNPRYLSKIAKHHLFFRHRNNKKVILFDKGIITEDHSW